MSEREDDFDFYDDEMPEGMVVCDRCNGDGTVDCMCCGDFCCCGWGDELPCQVCHGEGYITEARWEKRRAAHREIMQALWGDKASALSSELDSQAPTDGERAEQKPDDP